MVKINTNATWAAAPLLVRKPPPSKFRLTVDLRPVNSATVRTVWPMPHIESELADLAGRKCFATIDFCNAYWQLPLAEGWKHLHSFLTTNGVVQPTRTMPGSTNAGMNFQSKVEPCFSDIRDSLKAWLDDFLLAQNSEDGLLDVLNKFFTICRKKRLKISIRKSSFFCIKVKWCGRIIDEHGVHFDPRHLSGIMDCEMPISAGELCQYVNCMQWMSSAIPNFAARVAPLREVLERAYTMAGSRKKRAIQSIQLSLVYHGEMNRNGLLFHYKSNYKMP